MPTLHCLSSASRHGSKLKISPHLPETAHLALCLQPSAKIVATDVTHSLLGQEVGTNNLSFLLGGMEFHMGSGRGFSGETPQRDFF